MEITVSEVIQLVIVVAFTLAIRGAWTKITNLESSNNALITELAVVKIKQQTYDQDALEIKALLKEIDKKLDGKADKRATANG